MGLSARSSVCPWVTKNLNCEWQGVKTEGMYSCMLLKSLVYNVMLGRGIYLILEGHLLIFSVHLFLD